MTTSSYTARLLVLLVAQQCQMAAGGGGRFALSAVNFTGGDFSVQFGSGQSEGDHEPIAPLKMSVNVSLAEVYSKQKFLFAYDRTVWSHACERYGVCPACQGQGLRATTKRHVHPHTIATAIHTCPVCGGKRHLHRDCPEPTRQLQHARVLVQTPAGLNNTATLTFANAGDESQQQFQPRQFGDLELTLKIVNTDHSLKLNDSDVIKVIEMDAQMAVEGFEFGFEHVDGTWVLVDRRGKITLPGSELVIPGRGMPMPNSNDAGSLILRFNFGDMESGSRLKQPEQQTCTSRDTCHGEVEGKSVADEDAAFIHEVLLRKALQALADEFIAKNR